MDISELLKKIYEKTIADETLTLEDATDLYRFPDVVIDNIRMWAKEARPHIAHHIVEMLELNTRAGRLFLNIGDFLLGADGEKSLALEVIDAGFAELLLVGPGRSPVKASWLDQDVASALIGSSDFLVAGIVASHPKSFVGLDPRRTLEELARRHPSLLPEFARNFYGQD